jgi:hypothetical protein
MGRIGRSELDSPNRRFEAFQGSGGMARARAVSPFVATVNLRRSPGGTPSTDVESILWLRETRLLPLPSLCGTRSPWPLRSRTWPVGWR